MCTALDREIINGTNKHSLIQIDTSMTACVSNNLRVSEKIQCLQTSEPGEMSVGQQSALKLLQHNSCLLAGGVDSKLNLTCVATSSRLLTSWEMFAADTRHALISRLAEDV